MGKKINNTVMPVQAGIRQLGHLPAFAGLTLLLSGLIFLVTPALAAEASAESPAKAEETTTDTDKLATYSPDFCEFSVTFPGEPYTVQRCDVNDEKKCYDMISYTQVYDMTTTVNFRVLCSPVDPSLYKTYSAEVMGATLKAMTDRSVIKTYDTSFREEEAGYKQAGLVGEGQSGITSTLYIAQLWIGKQSAFSMEAELVGDTHDKADKLLSDVLKSVHFSGIKKPPENKKDEKESKKEEKEKE